MKFFILALLMAVCHAEKYSEEKEAFKQLAGISVNKIVMEIEREISQVLHYELPPEHYKLLDDLAVAFANTIRDELWRAVSKIMRVGHLSEKFTEKMVIRLKMAAAKIAEGLDMTPESFEEFFENILEDFKKFDVGGVFHVDLDKVFHDVIHTAHAMIHHKYSQRNDLSDILNNMNHTIMGILGHTQGINHHLGDIFGLILKAAVDTLQPHIENIKALAKDFLENIGNARENVLRQALHFLKPFASALGDVWTKLSKLAQDRLDQLAEEKHRTL